MNLKNTWFKMGVGAGTFLATNPVFAQQTLSTMTQTVGSSTNTLGTVLNAGCWGGGTLVFVKGLWGCYEHGKNSQTKLGPQIASLAGGTALLTAPSLIGTMVSALGTTASGTSSLQGMAQRNSF